MNTLLLYPAYPDTFWGFKHAIRYLRRKASIPPLGLLTVAALLPEAWNKKLVDLNVAELSDEQIRWADLVFIGAMLVQKAGARELIARAKALGKVVVAGGPAFTAQPELFPEVDHLVLNEAEATLPAFLADLAAGTARRVYTSDERPDITRTPVPLWSLIRLKDYVTIPVQYSRGCPFHCEFCDIVVMYGHTPRTKTPSQMIAELQSLCDAGWRETVFIVDDNFIGNKARVKELLPALIRWQRLHDYPFLIMTEASVNLAEDPELLELMRAANFHKVFLGIETPDADALAECGKTQNRSRDLTDVVRTIQAHGMQVMGGFIVGFDSDTETIFQRQIDFIQKAGIVMAMVGLLSALPHTRLWYRLNAEGRLRGEASGENTDGSLNFAPRMNETRLLDGYRQILAALYSPKNYYQRIHTFIRHYRPSVRGRITRDALLAFARSVWHIGILSRARLPYWRLILRTLLTRPRAFPLAVELAISGQHFQRITDRLLAGA